MGPPEPPAPTNRHNVPVALSSFVGRAGDVAALLSLVRTHRLTTVVGPGGAGKTRLLREALATEVKGPGLEVSFPQGIWWVDLAPVSRGEDVAGALANVLEITPSSGMPVLEAVSAALGSGRALVALDNCEHVIDDAARLADALLRGTTGVHVVATSREALAIEGEVAWVVPPLGCPELGNDAGGLLTSARALEYDAVRLFVERTQAASPAFAVSDANVQTVARICARLDGLPLALELAAAAVPILGIEGLAARLDDAIDLLSRGRRTALPRHRTLRAVLDGSYDLLGERERGLLRRLSVFRGSFTLEAAAAVCARAGGPEVVLGVGRLVELSLMEVREEDGEASYRLLETVRQYGAGLLADRPEANEVRRQHAEWIAGVAEAAEPSTFSAGRGRTVTRLRKLVEEIRAALAWATGPTGDPAIAIRLTGALGWYWISGHPWGEARALLDRTLAVAVAQGLSDQERPLADLVALGKLMYPIIGLSFFFGDTERMLATTQRDLALWDVVDAAPETTPEQRLSASRGRALALQLTGLARAMRGERELAIRAMNQCLAVSEACGDRWLAAVMRMRRALAWFLVGEPMEAQADFLAAVPALRALGERWFLSLALEGMAVNALARQDVVAAGAYARESILVLEPERDAWFISRSLDAIAVILLAQVERFAPDDQPERAITAARMMCAAQALRRRCGAGIIGPDVARHAETERALRARVGSAVFDRLSVAADEYTLDDVFDMLDRDPILRSLTPAVPVEGTEDAEARNQAGHGRAAPPARLEVALLGGWAMRDEHGDWGNDRLPAGKVLELFALLLLQEKVRKEEVGLALWPDASAAQLRNVFHVTLHHLRRSLGETTWISYDRGVYRLDRAPTVGPVMTVDLDEVRAAVQDVREWARRREAPEAARLDAWRSALARYRGDLTGGLVREDWIVAHQDALRVEWAEAMHVLAQLNVRAERVDEAASILEALLTREPLREQAHRLYLEVLDARGESARALAHFERLTSFLRREVGASPSAETVAVIDKVRQRR